MGEGTNNLLREITLEAQNKFYSLLCLFKPKVALPSITFCKLRSIVDVKYLPIKLDKGLLSCEELELRLEIEGEDLAALSAASE